MEKTTETYRKDIKTALRKAGTYNKGLDPQIKSLAGALRTLDLAEAQIDGLAETTVWETTRYGSKLAPHPVFRIQRDAQDSVTRQMRALGLTAAQLTGDGETDELVSLTQEAMKAWRKAPEDFSPAPGDEEARP